MRLFIVIAGLLLAAGAQAAETHVAANYTCAQLRSMVRSHGTMTIKDHNGLVTVHANHVVCHQNAMNSQWEIVQASDKGCVVGLSCSVYAEGMF